MIHEAKAREVVTLKMLKKRARCKLDDKVDRNALHQRRIRFRKMRTKPLLTKQDRKERFAFAQEYHCKSRVWWLELIHLHIDLKIFPMYTNAEARDCAAVRDVRGAYRARGDGFGEDYMVLPCISHRG